MVRIFSVGAADVRDEVDAFLLDDRNRRAPGFGSRKDTLNTIVDHPSTGVLLHSVFRDFCERPIL